MYEKNRINELSVEINTIQTSLNKQKENAKSVAQLSSFLNDMEEVATKAKKLKNVEPEFDENSVEVMLATLQSDSGRLDYVKSVNQSLRQAIEVIQQLE